MKSQNIDIKIKEIEYVKKSTKPAKIGSYSYTVPIDSKLTLEFKGKDSSNVIVNTLRRVVQDNVPTYAYCQEGIKISENTTIFNNDMMKLRLANLPVIGVDSDIHYLDPMYWKNTDYSDVKRNHHPDEKSIEMSINAYNDSNNIKNITTHDAKFYVDGQESDNYLKQSPILLVQLKKADTFKCAMRAQLGTGERDNIWAGASVAYYDDNTSDDATAKRIDNPENKINFSVESQGQLSEYYLLIKACLFINKRLDDIKTEIEKKIKSKEIKEAHKMILTLDGEDHTMGNLINYATQMHPEIIFCGGGKPDHLVKSFRIKIQSIDHKKSPLQFMFEQMDFCKNVYSHIHKELLKIIKK